MDKISESGLLIRAEIYTHTDIILMRNHCNIIFYSFILIWQFYFLNINVYLNLKSIQDTTSYYVINARENGKPSEIDQTANKMHSLKMHFVQNP